MWIAQNTETAGYVAFRLGWVDHLYVHPEHQKIGVGSTLLSKAKEASDALNAWVFARNVTALTFYRRRGFSDIDQTSGHRNEEQIPDVLLRWERH